MKVVEIFNSIEGEGKRVGLPCTFIRLFGCNLNCTYCDSRYACEGSQYVFMSCAEILEQIKMIGCSNITITGGEPLIHSGIENLLELLAGEGYYINVETNGTQIPICDNLRIVTSNIFYTVDYKTYSSGMSDRMVSKVFECLCPVDVLKFVVGNEDDLNQALEVVEKYHCRSNIYVSPIFGQIEPAQIVEFIKSHKLWNWHTQLQLHKYIWDPDKRGV